MTIWTLTAYCLCALCCGPWAGLERTAWGSRPVAGFTAACPPSLPLGSVVAIEGVGLRWCEDQGSAIRGHRADVLVASHAEAVRFGVRRARVRVLHRGGRR